MADNNWEKTLESLFIGLGLSAKEARVYRVVLEIGQGPATKIITNSGLKRGITYAVLASLEKHGLIRSFQKVGKTHFQAENPQKLLDLVEQRKKQAATLENSLKQVVPKLVSQYKLAVGKPTIRYFEGEEGIKKVFDDIYSPGRKHKQILGCVDISLPSRELYNHIVEKLIPHRIKNKIFARAFDVLSPQAEELQKHDKQQLREIFLVDGKTYPMPAEIDVYEDKIAMLSFDKGNFVGVIIENKSLAETLRSVFKIGFDLATDKKRRKGKNKLVT